MKRQFSITTYTASFTNTVHNILFVSNKYSVNKHTSFYSFGMEMPGRSFNASNYRFGYNKGSEKDDEITGTTGSHFTTFYREGDTRTMRWWSVDPKTVATPWESPYCFMGGNPILYNDPLGDIIDPTPMKKAEKRTQFAQVSKALINTEIFGTAIKIANQSNIVFTIKPTSENESFGTRIKREAWTYEITPRSYTDDVTEMAEEYFHMGQEAYYSNLGENRSQLAMEIEARVAKALVFGEGGNDPYAGTIFSEAKEYLDNLKSGKKIEKGAELKFNTMLNELGDILLKHPRYNATEKEIKQFKEDPNKIKFLKNIIKDEKKQKEK